MGSMCCKRLESPYSPKLPDFNKLFLSCTEQVQLCRKNLWDEDEPEPKQRKFSVSDISYPLPLGCTIIPPKRPPRKKKMILERTTSTREKSSKSNPSALRRTKSIHEIRISDLPKPIEKASPEYDPHSRADPPTLDSPTTDEIVLNVIRAASGSSVLDSPSESPSSRKGSPEPEEDTDPQCTPVEPVLFTRPYYSDFLTPNLPPLEPILESAFESLESTSSVSLVAENKKHFLATLLEDSNNNNNNNLPSRKSSITESLREFECSLYDMLEQESTKDEVDEIKWRPQIPVYSYH